MHLEGHGLPVGDRTQHDALTRITRRVVGEVLDGTPEHVVVGVDSEQRVRVDLDAQARGGSSVRPRDCLEELAWGEPPPAQRHAVRLETRDGPLGVAGLHEGRMRPEETQVGRDRRQRVLQIVHEQRRERLLHPLDRPTERDVLDHEQADGLTLGLERTHRDEHVPRLGQDGGRES